MNFLALLIKYITINKLFILIDIIFLREYLNMEEMNIIQNANTIKGYLDGTIKCPDDKLKNATIRLLK